MMAYEDPNSPGNSPVYHTGKSCLEKGCNKPAGTYWSPWWCFEHNVERIRRINKGIEGGLAKLRELQDRGVVKR